MLEFGELWNEIIHCIHHHSQVSQQILLVQTLLYKVIWLKLAQICAKYFKIAILIRGFISTFAKYINLTENCIHFLKKSVTVNSVKYHTVRAWKSLKFAHAHFLQNFRENEFVFTFTENWFHEFSIENKCPIYAKRRL